MIDYFCEVFLCKDQMMSFGTTQHIGLLLLQVCFVFGFILKPFLKLNFFD